MNEIQQYSNDLSTLLTKKKEVKKQKKNDSIKDNIILQIQAHKTDKLFNYKYSVEADRLLIWPDFKSKIFEVWSLKDTKHLYDIDNLDLDVEKDSISNFNINKDGIVDIMYNKNSYDIEVIRLDVFTGEIIDKITDRNELRNKYLYLTNPDKRELNKKYKKYFEEAVKLSSKSNNFFTYNFTNFKPIKTLNRIYGVFKHSELVYLDTNTKKLTFSSPAKVNNYYFETIGNTISRKVHNGFFSYTKQINTINLDNLNVSNKQYNFKQTNKNYIGTDQFYIKKDFGEKQFIYTEEAHKNSGGIYKISKFSKSNQLEQELLLQNEIIDFYIDKKNNILNLFGSKYDKQSKKYRLNHLIVNTGNMSIRNEKFIKGIIPINKQQILYDSQSSTIYFLADSIKGFDHQVEIHRYNLRNGEIDSLELEPFKEYPNDFFGHKVLRKSAKNAFSTLRNITIKDKYIYGVSDNYNSYDERRLKTLAKNVKSKYTANSLVRLFKNRYEKSPQIKFGIWNKKGKLIKELDYDSIFYINKKETNLYIYNGYDGIDIYDLTNFKIVDQINISLDAGLHRIYTHKDKLLLQYDTYFEIFSLITKEKLIELRVYGNETILATTPEGYFYTTDNLIANYDLFHYVKDKKDVISLNSLYDVFFRPDLVKLKLQGKNINQYIKNINIQSILEYKPPVVSINKAYDKTDHSNYNLNFNIKANSGGIGLIRIYQEGKLIKTIGDGKINRELANVDDKLLSETENRIASENQKKYLMSRNKLLSKSISGKITENELIKKVSLNTSNNKEGHYSLEIELKAGKNNIEVEAFNGTSTIVSKRASLVVNAKIPKRKPIIYTIVAGVNQFEKTGYLQNLKYSENDAIAIKNAIKKKIKEKVEVKLFTGEDLTKDNIYKAIEEIKSKAKLEDKIVFYISTHGTSANGDLYLVPHNNKKFRNWIKFEELFHKIQSIKTLEQIFIIDACESGKAKDIVASIYDSKASVLAKQSGVHILLATTKGTFAFEHPNPKIKHSVFTNNILNALKERNTDKNKDNKISVIELSEVLKSPKYFTEQQYPVIRNVGKDTKIRDLH